MPKSNQKVLEDISTFHKITPRVLECSRKSHWNQREKLTYIRCYNPVLVQIIKQKNPPNALFNWALQQNTQRYQKLLEIYLRHLQPTVRVLSLQWRIRLHIIVYNRREQMLCQERTVTIQKEVWINTGQTFGCQEATRTFLKFGTMKSLARNFKIKFEYDHHLFEVPIN